VPDVVPGPWRYNGFKKGGNQLGLSLINFAWRFSPPCGGQLGAGDTRGMTSENFYLVCVVVGFVW